jgi:branched-chain amino acid transport system permease protein
MNTSGPNRTLIAALVLFVVAGIFAFRFDNYELQVGTSVAMLCTLCLAWNIVGGYMGYPSLATAAFFGIGCYAGAITQTAGLPISIAWCAAAMIGALTALLLGLPLLRLKGHYFAIGTIAALEVFREVANNWGWLTGGAIGINLPILPGSAEMVGRFFFWSMLGLTLVTFIITYLIEISRFGFGLRCIRQNEEAASMIGIDVIKYKVCAFILSGTLCSSAGAIYASMVGFIEPKDAFSLITTIEIPVMVMLGGLGTLIGPLLGGVFYVILKEFVWANFISWHSGILGIIIVMVIYFLPDGVLGARLKAIRGLLGRHPQTEKRA